MLKPSEINEAMLVASDVVALITVRQSLNGFGPAVFRTPEQIALITELVQKAIYSNAKSSCSKGCYEVNRKA